MGTKSKVFLLSLFTIFIGVLIADVIVSLNHRGMIQAGAEGFICEAFRFGDSVLNGYNFTDVGNHTFIGVENVESIVANLTELTDANSSVMVSISEIVKNTQPIETAVQSFLVYLDHANAIFSDPTNSVVGAYECVFCASGSINDTMHAVSTSVANALVNVRSKIGETLTGQGLSDIQSSLATASSVIDSFKTQAESTVSSTLIDNRTIFDDIVKYINIASIVIVSSMGVPMLILSVSVFFGVFRSNEKSFSDPLVRPRRPFCCGWCIHFLYAFVLFAIAGIVGLVSFGMSSLCVVLSDLPALFSDKIDDLQIRNILIDCLTLEGKGDILNAISASGNASSIADSLNISALIDEKFDSLSSATGSFASIPMLQNLSDYGTLYLVSPSRILDPSLKASQALVELIGRPAIDSLIQQGLEGVPDCDGKSGRDGANGFYYTLSTFGIDIGVSSSSNMTCPESFASLNPPNLTLAHPFEVLMDWKIQVLTHNFRCDSVALVVDSDGSVSSSVTPANCSWSQWLQYIHDMQDQLVAAAQAVDDSTANVLSSIENDLQDIVQRMVLPQIDTLAHGLDCKFMYASFNNIYADLCYLETPGIIYSVITWLVFGGLCWIAILIEFIIWRHLRDNLSIWLDFKRAHSSSHKNTSRVSPIADAIPSPRVFSQATIGYRAQNIIMN